MKSVPNSIVITPNEGTLSATDDIIRSRILTMRGVQVILDRDIAMLYGVETKVLNQAVKRNRERFPDRFMFQLTGEELVNWKSQIVTSNPSLEQTIRWDKLQPVHLPKQGEFTAVELFAGAGGLSIGLERAGIRAVIANEIMPDFAATLAANRLDAKAINEDSSLEAA